MLAGEKAHTAPTSWFRAIQLLVYGSILLYFGRDVFIPLSFALLISFVLYPICSWLERRGAGRMGAVLGAMTILGVLGILLLVLLVSQFLSFLSEWPSLQLKLVQAADDLSRMLLNVFGITKDQQVSILSRMTDQVGGRLFQILQHALSASAYSAVLFVLIPVYAVLILYYRHYWLKVMDYLFPAESKENLRKIIRQSIRAYYNFIKGMLLVYLLVGALNSLGLLAMGVPYALLFGFIASILTFIPFVGILVGSLLPITIAWITYDSIWYPVGIIAVFTFVQYLEANVIFPLVVSNRLQVNTLVMLLAIFAGGVLWGIAGMILFVPFVGIAKLIADHNPKWKAYSLILGMEHGTTAENKQQQAPQEQVRISESPAPD